MRRKQRPLFTVVIDSREQTPYRFGPPHRKELDDGGSIISALDAGDYSCLLNGVLLPVRIERKSLSDLYGVVGHGRGRFAGDKKDGTYRVSEESGEWAQSELLRLRPYKSFLIIEAQADVSPSEIRLRQWLQSIAAEREKTSNPEVDRLAGRAQLALRTPITDAVRAGYERSQIPGEAAWGSVISWCLQYGIVPLFCGSHRTGNACCARLLEEFAIQTLDERIDGR
jgi:hypothetical protein